MACLSRQRLSGSAFCRRLPVGARRQAMSGRLALTTSRLGLSPPVWSLLSSPGSAGARRQRCQREERREHEHDDPADVTSQHAAWPATRRAAASRCGAAPGGESRRLAGPGAAEPGGPLVRADTPRRQPRDLGDQLAARPVDRVPRPWRVGRRVRRGLGNADGAPGGRGDHDGAGAGQAGGSGRGAGVRSPLHPRCPQRRRLGGGGERARVLAAAAGDDALRPHAGWAGQAGHRSAPPRGDGQAAGGQQHRGDPGRSARPPAAADAAAGLRRAVRRRRAHRHPAGRAAGGRTARYRVPRSWSATTWSGAWIPAATPGCPGSPATTTGSS